MRTKQKMRPHFSSSSTDSPDVLPFQSLAQLFLEAVLTDTAFSFRNRLVKLVSLDWISWAAAEFWRSKTSPSSFQCAASLTQSRVVRFAALCLPIPPVPVRCLAVRLSRGVRLTLKSCPPTRGTHPSFPKGWASSSTARSRWRS